MTYFWSLSDSKSAQIFRTLLSILADLNKFVVSMVLTGLLISKSSSPWINPTIIIYTLKFSTSTLTDGLSLEFKWQQVSSSLQDYSQYSGRSQ